MKIKTSELTGAALDWAVAKCEGNLITFDRYGPSGQWEMYSTNWAQGGPIIDREKITVVCAEGDYNPSKSGTPDCFDTYWAACIGKLRPDEIYGPQGDAWGRYFQIEDSSITGPTPLVAGLRCYVASKLGDVVDVPEELL